MSSAPACGMQSVAISLPLIRRRRQVGESIEQIHHGDHPRGRRQVSVAFRRDAWDG